MIVFGIDIPLVEILLTMTIVAAILITESVIIIFLLVQQMNKIKRIIGLFENLSTTMLEIKKKEIEQLDKLRGKR